MHLGDYFESRNGFGVLSTADGDGIVDAAVYSRPHVGPDGSLEFIMRDRLSHENLQSNPHAMYLFREETAGYHGIRLFLTKIAEDDDPERIRSLRRRQKAKLQTAEESRFVVTFRVDKAIRLIGAEEIEVQA